MRGIVCPFGTLPAMMGKLAKGLVYLAYGMVVVLIFGLAAYTSFSLFVRSGVTTVPAVEGLSRGEAAARLADQGLRLRGVEEEGRYHEKVPAGSIVQQSPDARTLVKRGSSVSVVLSRGPQRVEVPDLAGKRLPEAQALLSGNGLTVGRILGAFSETGSTGSVLASDPGPGATIPPSAPVHVLLALSVPSERFVMPDLVYRDYEDIRRYFERQGFRFGNVKFERYEGVSAGVILRQYPLPGHPVTRQDNISLVVATADSLPDGPPAPGPMDLTPGTPATPLTPEESLPR